MIIISQDERSIINFEQVKVININRLEPIEIAAYFNCDYINNNDNILLGKYRTEERAKEVLQKIIKEYSSCLELKGGPAIMQGQMDIQPNIFNIPKVFRMPKE